MSSKLAGYTLVEILVAASLFTILSLAIYSVMDTSNVIFKTNDARAQLNHSGMQILRNISSEVGESSPLVDPENRKLFITNGATDSIRFQVPVDWDRDGDVTEDTLQNTIEWGAYEHPQQAQAKVGENPLDRWAQYRVNNNNQLIREVLNAGLAAIAGLDDVVANGVTGFTVERNANILNMSVTLSVTDAVGQEGDGRIFTTTVAHETFLRNAVE